jgi:hypothetical protein
MERGVALVLELGFGDALMIVDHAIADQLDLWDSKNGLEIGVKD